MILDRIKIENFGAYGGEQYATLSPREDQAVILFGGMNGGGKTTLLDALLLVLYGSRAKVSNRGRMAYKRYLKECIHRGADPEKGSLLELEFRRKEEGVYHKFTVRRTWKETSNGIDEDLVVLKDGSLDHATTEHWDEVIEAYLPVAISNLFFFDGEQIKELAEGSNAAAILGSAIRSLLGLDIVDRLENDLKVFERKKKAETMDSAALQELNLLEAEFEALDAKEGELLQEAGTLRAHRLKSSSARLKKAEERFKNEGGELFEKRKEIESKLNELASKKGQLEDQLRALAAGPLALCLIPSQLENLYTQSKKEQSVSHNRLLLEVIDERDEQILEVLDHDLSATALKRVSRILAQDRKLRAQEAEEDLILEIGESLLSEVSHLQGKLLQDEREKAVLLVSEIRAVENQISQIESELVRIPEADSVKPLRQELDEAKEEHFNAEEELNSIEVRTSVIQGQKSDLLRKIERVGDQCQQAKAAEDSRSRMLKHSSKVRTTLESFRTKVISRHVQNIERLMLDSFRQLLRKQGLVNGLIIDPETFVVSLKDKDGNDLPFDRLSAGERQLLATAMLWGLARASGRPIPMVIDTPLGRLDSSHRTHLVDRYFPVASHQVLLLSTDEEIVGDYHKKLKANIANHYLLSHDEEMGRTSIIEGYFSRNEATA